MQKRIEHQSRQHQLSCKKESKRQKTTQQQKPGSKRKEQRRQRREKESTDPLKIPSTANGSCSSSFKIFFLNKQNKKIANEHSWPVPKSRRTGLPNEEQKMSTISFFSVSATCTSSHAAHTPENISSASCKYQCKITPKLRFILLGVLAFRALGYGVVGIQLQQRYGSSGWRIWDSLWTVAAVFPLIWSCTAVVYLLQL